MPSVTGDIEEKDESLPRIMSMRRKVALGGFAFMFCICAILLVSSPGIVESYTKITTFDEGRKATNDSNIEDIMNKKEFSALTQLDCEVKAELPTGQNKDDGYETIVFDDVFDGEIPWYSTNNQKTIRDGNLFLNLKPNRIGNSCSIYHRCNFVYAGFETRLRISSPEVPMLALGFASNEAEVVFMWFSNESSEFARGLHAYCKIDRIGEFYEPIEIELDISEWHTYQVIWQSDNATFIVDGEVVAQTDKVADARQEVWIYSMCKASDILSSDLGSTSCSDLRNVEISELQFTEIDYIRIFDVMGDDTPLPSIHDYGLEEVRK